jgi:hypothetical protein
MKSAAAESGDSHTKTDEFSRGASRDTAKCGLVEAVRG